MTISKSQPSQFSSSIKSGLVKTRIARNQPQEVYIGNHLVAIDLIQINGDGDLKLMLEFESIDGTTRRCIISRLDLAGRGTTKIFSTLLAQGYCFERKYRNAIIDYLLKLGEEIPLTDVNISDYMVMHRNVSSFCGSKDLAN